MTQFPSCVCFLKPFDTLWGFLEVIVTAVCFQIEIIIRNGLEKKSVNVVDKGDKEYRTSTRHQLSSVAGLPHHTSHLETLNQCLCAQLCKGTILNPTKSLFSSLFEAAI